MKLVYVQASWVTEPQKGQDIERWGREISHLTLCYSSFFANSNFSLVLSRGCGTLDKGVLILFLSTGARDFRHGYETILHYFVWV